MIIVGLGNPGEEYEGTRHNSGRMAVMHFAKKQGFDDFEFDKKADALVAKGKVGKKPATLVLPETYMNKSGNALKPYVTSAKKAAQLIVVHDDLDLPLGRAKMSWNKSSGGHKGVESVIRAVKTEEFWRIRIGISKEGKNGSVKKPSGEKLLTDFIVAPFKPAEMDEVKKVWKAVAECLEMAVAENPGRAMSDFNASFNK
ncbi:MAG: aminoacyl-tRNA hydrolase [Candidatus Paceibacterota bacterium]|jgi:PTH1 family peptidyl-tRNA hydrolase